VHGDRYSDTAAVSLTNVSVETSNLDSGTDNAVVVAAEQPTRQRAAPGPPESSRARKSGFATHDPSVYRRAADASLPRWLHILGAAPWLSAERPMESHACPDGSALYRQQAAALAIALCCELDRDRPDHAYLHESVRASLIHWQLSLLGDGRPAQRDLRASPLHSATLALVGQLLSETVGFETDLLLDDFDRHVRWIARRTAQSPWLEAAAICAMADGALLVRDASLLKLARNRLAGLIARQDDEGWFPERGGADIGRLSLTLDALARVYAQNEWAELEVPLERAVGFLIHFVHPDGSAGGCYSSCDSGFLSPYGLELLGESNPEAAALALAFRRRCAELSPDRLFGCDDGLCAALGASICLAAVHAQPHLAQPCPYPCETRGQTRFPHAGLSIYSTDAYFAVVNGKKGGALRVNWRNGAADLDDPGVVVSHPRAERTSALHDPRIGVSVSDTTVTSSGVLRRTRPKGGRRARRIRRWLRSVGSRLQPTTTRPVGNEAQPRGTDHKRHARDRYVRKITFSKDRITIRDEVHTNPPCQTIVCQSPLPAGSTPFGNGVGSCPPARSPIFVEGGRVVRITRTYRDGQLVDEPTEAEPKNRPTT